MVFVTFRNRIRILGHYKNDGMENKVYYEDFYLIVHKVLSRTIENFMRIGEMIDFYTSILDRV